MEFDALKQLELEVNRDDLTTIAELAIAQQLSRIADALEEKPLVHMDALINHLVFVEGLGNCGEDVARNLVRHFDIREK